MKMTSFRSGLISGTVGFLGTCIWVSWAILHSTSSTAAIGFVFLPIQAGLIALLFFPFGYCAHFALATVHPPRRTTAKLLAAGTALAILSLFLYWLGSGLILCKVVNDVRNASREELAQFLNTSIFKENKFALNAVLERQDLDAPTLYKIAQIPSRELHTRMGSLFPVMGKNTRGLAVMRLVARHQNVDAKTLALLANSSDDYVLGDVAGNPNTPPEILPRIFAKGGYLIDWGIARNPNCPPGILHELALRDSEYTRAAVAQNKATRLDDLERLVKDPVWHVRDGVSMNPNCPLSLKDRLRNDPDERVRRRFHLR